MTHGTSGCITGDRACVVDARTLHRGRKFDFVSLDVRRASGKVLTREVVRHPGAVVVVAVTARGELVLIKNFRIAVGGGQWLYECCAGTIERSRLDTPTPGETFVPFGSAGAEDPKACAARELIEETGYAADQLHDLGWFYTTPGMTDERMFAFVATGLTHVGQKLEEDESIDVELVPAAQALEMAYDGRIRDAKSMLAILMASQRGFFVK